MILRLKIVLKGTVARDFWRRVFSRIDPIWTLIHILKQFRILIRILGDN
jgi:hypothetical protein